MRNLPELFLQFARLSLLVLAEALRLGVNRLDLRIRGRRRDPAQAAGFLVGHVVADGLAVGAMLHARMRLAAGACHMPAAVAQGAQLHLSSYHGTKSDILLSWLGTAGMLEPSPTARMTAVAEYAMIKATLGLRLFVSRRGRELRLHGPH